MINIMVGKELRYDCSALGTDTDTNWPIVCFFRLTFVINQVFFEFFEKWDDFLLIAKCLLKALNVFIVQFIWSLYASLHSFLDSTCDLFDSLEDLLDYIFEFLLVIGDMRVENLSKLDQFIDFPLKHGDVASASSFQNVLLMHSNLLAEFILRSLDDVENELIPWVFNTRSRSYQFENLAVISVQWIKLKQIALRCFAFHFTKDFSQDSLHHFMALKSVNDICH